MRGDNADVRLAWTRVDLASARDKSPLHNARAIDAPRMHRRHCCVTAKPRGDKGACRVIECFSARAPPLNFALLCTGESKLARVARARRFRRPSSEIGQSRMDSSDDASKEPTIPHCRIPGKDSCNVRSSINQRTLIGILQRRESTNRLELFARFQLFPLIL